MTSNPFAQEFWIYLRNKTVLKDTIGHCLCWVWCNDSLDLLVEEGINEFRKKIASGGNVLREKGLNLHWWLEADTNKGRYVADGTAGQINPDYPLGFYGSLKEAPTDLAEVYSNGH
tara:strand:+ start:19429 stop:19776 length:348 start_codon:yes stop_codon:yes gene_type:complete